ncbi:MAG TPA: SDR family oxidoreductase [Planctomycetota bacterium]|nr:SDR family oxidoreductase [Planctomycetota bacterium]
MKILIIGGTGTISQAVTELAAARGHEIWLLNRGQRDHGLGKRVHNLVADKNNRAAMRAALGDLTFDAVANFIAFTAEELADDVALFLGRTAQYLVISSASVYQKPPNHYRITESTPAHNPFWLYSRNKIALENAAMAAYREKGFPVTIVRPSYTYSQSSVPGLFGLGFQHFERLRQGKPLIVHSDGQTLWQMTWNEDFALGFVGLLGNPRALGETFHITSDEVLTWNQIFQTMGRAIGVEPKLVGMPVEFIGRAEQSVYDGLKGDKMYSLVLDNSKIKSVVPDYQAKVSFYEGMRRCLAWLEKNPRAADAGLAGSAKIDRLLGLWEKALAEARPAEATR